MNIKKERFIEVYNLLQADIIITAMDMKSGIAIPQRRGTKVAISLTVIAMIIIGTITFANGAAPNFFVQIGKMISSVYGYIVGLSTAVAALFLAIAIIWAATSTNSRHAESAISWCKRILVCWIVLNLLGTIFTLASNLTQGGNLDIDSSGKVTL